MTRRIEILPDTVANQIAAGEVVERPASVVKELVENAIDAGARLVEIDIEQGGKRRIRVADDGIGMGKEDLLLSLDRHATSKIRSAQDLQAVRSFGFRGEALPSIAAVSRLRIESRERGEEAAFAVRARGGQILGIDEASRRTGTTVEVENLFFNAPARAKFLKSSSVETRAVSDALVSLALAHPEVAIRYRSDQRVLLDLPAVESIGERVAALWGADSAATLIPVTGEHQGIRLHGWIQRPDQAKPGFRRAHLFVHRRPFREPRLLRAVDDGYRTTVPERAKPWIFLRFEVPPGSVDVNVHPSKAEVRFRSIGPVLKMIEESVRSTLEGLESAATFSPGFDRSSGEGALSVRERMSDVRAGSSEPSPPAESQMALFVPLGAPTGDSAADGGDGAAVHSDAALESPEGVTDDGPRESPAVRPDPPRLWQVLNMYIVAETRDGLLIIDQHSAHERVLFEEIMKRWEGAGMASQRLLFPITIRLSTAEYQLVDELGSLLARAGFEVEGFGGDTIIVHSVPTPHPYFDPERCIREMLDELTHGSELVRSAKNQHERIAMSFACKGAIKAGQPLRNDEIRELFDRLFATELPFHDVHGRPTTVRLTGAELDRKFGR